VAWRRQHTAWTSRPVADWIAREFASRGLVPPHCTPEALARVLERERQITILFQPYASNDPGVYGLLCRPVASPHLAIILFRPTYSLTLRCLILFHELAHLLLDHPVPAGPCRGARGVWGARRHEADAEAFAVGACSTRSAPGRRTRPAWSLRTMCRPRRSASCSGGPSTDHARRRDPDRDRDRV